MTGPIFSPDGKWMWDGNAWIPAPPQANVLPQASLNQTQISTVANNAGVPVNQLSNSAPYFDQNRDGILQNTELQQAAAAIAQPPTMPVPMQQPMVQQPMVQQPMVQQPMVQQSVPLYNSPNLPNNVTALTQNKSNSKMIFAILTLCIIIIASSVFYIWKDNIAPEYNPSEPIEGTWLFCPNNCATEFGDQIFEVKFSSDKSFSGWTDDYDVFNNMNWSTEGFSISLGFKYQEGWAYQEGKFEIIDELLFVSLYTDTFPNGTTSQRQPEGSTFVLIYADTEYNNTVIDTPEIFNEYLDSKPEWFEPPTWWMDDLQLAGPQE